MRNKNFLKNPYYLILPIAIISAILIFLLYRTINLEEQIEEKMFEISTSDVLSITQNSAKSIQSLLKEGNNYIEDIKINTLLQRKIEQNLKTLLTKNIKYAYILYRDNGGIFRFLVDASNNEEKAFLNQKFDVDSPQWIEIYDKKEPLIIKHTILHQLSISYLIPIVYNDKVELILAIDFSIKKIEDINKIIGLIKNGIFGIIVIIFIFLIIFLIQATKYRAIKKTAFMDKLTNVYNRNYLQKYEDIINLNDYILATLDIDYFKTVNDTYGHDVGDKILKQIAKTMLLTLRAEDDIVIRYGGEEFLILAKITRNDRLSALNVIERILKNIQDNKFYISKKDFIHVTVSIGVNLMPHQSKNFSDAFKLADIALYAAKNKGRNTIEIYE